MIANHTSIPYEYINENSFQENDTQFLRHLCSVESQNRHPYFRNLVEKLVPKYGSYELIISSIHTINLDTSMWDSL